MARVVIYTTATCGYCHAAKRVLSNKNVDYEEIDVGGRADLRSWLSEVSHQHTVPQIFINGASIGGFSELAALEQRGELNARLQTEPHAGDAELRR